MFDFSDRVAIVTGAGGGLGRSHALGLAARGATVVVNDIGAPDAAGTLVSAPVSAVVEEIRSAGGMAVASPGDVTDPQQMEEMVARTVERFGRVDILVNNAGNLRDKSFAKLDLRDFNLVVKVHLIGSANCTSAVWKQMQQQNYGRVVFTSSSAGLYGNFGQSAYAASKMAMIGLMNTLHLEGMRYGIRVNCLVPGAATQMLDGLVSKEMAALLTPEAVTPGLLYLTGEDAPSRLILCATAGAFSVAQISEAPAVFLAEADRTPEGVAEAVRRAAADPHRIAHSEAFEQLKSYADLAVKGAR